MLEEPKIQENSLILVQQTCLKMTEDTSMFEIENFKSHFNSCGNGKGVAVYYKEELKLEESINHQNYQMSKFSSKDEDVICIYRSTTSNLDLQREFTQEIISLMNNERRQIFIGDFNIEASGNLIVQEFRNKNFSQLLNFPTHEDGGIIDHCYISSLIQPESIKVKQKAVYYSDHDLLKIRFV